MHMWITSDRLKTPLIRRTVCLQPATWDEALDLVAQRLGKVVQDHGPQAVAGLGSTHITNEANYLFQRFMRTVVGNNNIDHLGRGAGWFDATRVRCPIWSTRTSSCCWASIPVLRRRWSSSGSRKLCCATEPPW